MMSEQLSFDLPPNVSLGPEDYFLSDANTLAYRQVTGPDDWPDGKLALIGPPLSGKSHLLRVWQAQTKGAIWSAKALPHSLPHHGALIAVEDIHNLPRASEETLFHLHNHLAQSQGKLIVSSRQPLATLDIELPDLRSRLLAMSIATIPDPDEDLLCAVLAKQFSDRQLFPEAEVITYLIARIERSFAAASEVVRRMDQLALSKGQKITKSIARAALAQSTLTDGSGT